MIGSLLLTFAVGVLFRRSGSAALGPFVLPAPEWATLSPVSLGLALLAGVMLFRLHRGVIETVLALGALGVAFTFAARMAGA